MIILESGRMSRSKKKPITLARFQFLKMKRNKRDLDLIDGQAA